MYKRINWFSSNKILYFVIFFILIVLSIEISVRLTLGWDSQKFRFYKTLNFYNEGTIIELTNQPLGDGYSYPFLGSLLWAFFWKISFISEEYSGRLFYALIYILALFSLSDKLKTNLIIKIIFSIFLLLISFNYNLFGGEQDILIFSFVSFLAFFIHEIFINKIRKLKPLNLLIIPLIFNCLIWIKHEGTIYSLIVLFILIFFSKIQLKEKITLFLSTIFLIFLKIFIFYFFSLDITINSCCWNDISLSSILSNVSFDRILDIIKYFIYSFFKNYFFIISVLILMICLFYKIKIRKIEYIYLFYLLSFGFIITAYMSMDNNVDISYMLKVGLDRLLYGISPFFILIAVEFFNSQKKN